MLFGKIDYLNLLPFHCYVKQSRRYSGRFKRCFAARGGTPAEMNALFKRRKIDAAFISSIEARKCRCTGAGIVADGAVWSVLVRPGTFKKDGASATSNRLAKVLGVEGEVMIGDRALRAYFQDDSLIDLGQLWKDRTGLPFVFARLCFHRHSAFYRALAEDFIRSKTRIPYYILWERSRKIGLSPKQMLAYLERIHYRIDHRAKRGLKQYYGQSDRILVSSRSPGSVDLPKKSI